MDWNRIAFLRRVLGDLGAPPDIASAGEGRKDAHWNSMLKDIIQEAKEKELWGAALTRMRFAVIDMETTGFDHKIDDIISIAVEEVAAGKLTGRRYFSLVKPERNMSISTEVERMTGIYSEQVLQAPDLSKVLREVLSFIGGDVLIAHHARLDTAFLTEAVMRLWNLHLSHHVVDTGVVARIVGQCDRIPSLDELLQFYPVTKRTRHQAVDDALMTAEIWLHMIPQLQRKHIETFGELMEAVVAYTRRSNG